jgi:hypothetical protein
MIAVDDRTRLAMVNVAVLKLLGLASANSLDCAMAKHHVKETRK